mgnify:CR=1 FL=1
MVSSALSFIFNLIIFLLSLCVLICLHELGHLSMAKLFKVYCYEYSIGMGPLIYQHQGINKKTGKKRELKFLFVLFQSAVMFQWLEMKMLKVI